ncbi:hypothetical protein ACHAXT_009328 [Thalassiosira profunda]
MSYPLRYVDHTYRDYSRYIEDGGKIAKHKKSEKNFPAKVHQMLSDPRNADAIAWMPHGRAWRVIDKTKLLDEVIPQYLVCKKYDSFSRQLNGWGFKRLYQTGPDKGCYYHEKCFLRGKPKLTSLIRRLPTNLGKATPYPEGEPNFYRIDEAYPLPPPSSSSPEAEAKGVTAATSDEPPTIHRQPDVMHQPPYSSTQPATKSEETPPRGQPNEHPMEASTTESVTPFASRPPMASRGATEPVAPSFASRAPPAFRDPAGYGHPYTQYPPNADSYYQRDGYYQQQPPPTSTAPFNQEYSPYYQQHSPSRSSVPYTGESYGYPGRRYEYGEYGMPDGQHPNIPPPQHQQPWPPPPQYPEYQYPPNQPAGPPVARELVPNADQMRDRASVESWPRQCSISRRGSSVQPEDDLEPIPFSPRQASDANVGSDLIQRNRTM